METVGCAIPDFGNVLERSSLVRLFKRRAPALTIIVAPSGYGKSVLAAQFARSRGFAACFWVNLGDRGGSEEDILAALVSALDPGTERQGPTAAVGPIESARSGWMLSLMGELDSMVGQPLCIVLDGADVLEDLESVRDLSQTLRERTSGGTCLVVTCRSLEDSVPVSPATEWVIEDLDLRFTRDEVVRLMDDWLGEPGPDGVVDALLDRSGGQPALVCLMISHPEIDIDGPLSRDLRWHIRRMLTALKDESVRALYAASMLQVGELRDVRNCLDGPAVRIDFRALSRAVPLFRLSHEELNELAQFRTHASLREVVVEVAAERLDPSTAECIRTAAIKCLLTHDDYVRVLGVLTGACTPDEVARWCESVGPRVLRAVGPLAMAECLARVSPISLSDNPRLLLLSATVLRQQERIDEAMSHAVLARRLAEHAGENELVVESAMLMARLALDVGRSGEVPGIIADLSTTALSAAPPLVCCVIEAYRAIAHSHAGNLAIALECAVRVQGMLSGVDEGSDEHVFAVNSLAAVQGGACGRWDLAESAVGRVSRRGDLSSVQRLMVRANHGVTLLELGLVDDARQLLASVLQETDSLGLHHLRGYVLGTLAGVLATRAGLRDSEDAFAESSRLLAGRDDTFGLAVGWAMYAQAVRAHGDAGRALALAERADGAMAPLAGSLDLFRLAARIEVAASLLALGDQQGAARAAQSVKQQLPDPNACAHHLKADLVLAECDRRDGDAATAITRLAPHAEYINTGSLNLQGSFYIRSFPALLPLLAAAMGAEMLPTRLIALLPPETAAEALLAAPEICDAETVEALRSRLSASARADEAGSFESDAESQAFCRVQLFGGLRVTTEYGAIPDVAWRKRKARAMFLMLVMRRGQDVSRDMLLEHLWPNLSLESARNNYYVTWGAMKSILGGKHTPRHADNYVHTAGGLCRVTAAVSSDLDDLDAAIAQLKAAERAGDVECMASAARAVADVYRGELLPGDVYDDWFGEIRERTRQDFCAAMLLAGRFFETRGDYDSALEYLRRASSVDAWREDVYQAMMRCNMHSGRRGGAIETFMACRSKLTEDLGIDPSAETMRLYEAILAMDSEPDTPYGDGSSGL